MSIVNLVSITPKAEELIAYCARVSNPSNQLNTESERLIKYLITHKHWSPFEMAHVVIEVNTSRAVAAQLLRHRSFSFQEFSQRYADVSLMDFAKPPAFRSQDNKNRQNSVDDISPERQYYYGNEVRKLYEASERLYKTLLSEGVAKECAREILPLGTPSRLYVSGTVRSWLHYCDLRQANGTQKEHQDIALGCIDILRAELPTVCAAMWSSEK